MQIINELKELSLEDNEIKVYLACLSLGSSKVKDISQKSELIRTTTYGVLKSLIQKGLISTVLRNNIFFYQAATPKQLIEILNEKKRKISKILPKLEEMHKLIPTKHKVESFEGKEGLKTIFNEFVSEPNLTVKIIGFYGKWLDSFNIWTDIYFKKKKDQNTKSLVLIDEKERKHAEDKRIANSKIRYIENLDINAECFIYKNKVAFASFSKNELKGVIIENKEVFNLQNKLFDKLWEKAKS